MGTIRARKWVGTAGKVFSSGWLIIGLLNGAIFYWALPHASTLGATPRDSAIFRSNWILMAVLITGFNTLLPMSMLLCYWNRSVQATIDARNNPTLT